jgi:hypothetical protein
MEMSSIIFNQPFKQPHQVALDKLISKSEHLLLKISSIRLLDLCPDVLTVDENKVNIFHNDFFGTGDAHNILIENITSVSTSSAPLSSSLEIVDSCNPRAPVTYEIHNLKSDEAHQARRLILGLMVARRNGLDLKEFDDLYNLERQLEQLGDTTEVS